MTLTRRVRRCAWLAFLLAVVLAVAAPVANASTTATTTDTQRPPSYELLQMNLCLSGIAGCYAGTHYPAVVDEAVDKIRTNAPDVATLVETCSGDAQRIADETGYHLAFGAVIYKGAQLPCVKPTGRGVYGITVLTRRPIAAVDDAPYQAQNGNEQRRRVCATTVDGQTACVTHLAVRDADPAGPNSAANDGQCAEFGELLAGFASTGRPVIAAGDMNRQTTCVPVGFWTRQDSAASQSPGIQHAYGTYRWFHHPVATTPPMTYSDHDALLVTSLFS
ncbi:endonuclease/exonuclease/phosphatase family protein [Actinopolymorpha singaporensis]|uniref:Endonuclease/Exonuclease/phosphatase family protein n=1 Tax=Actinopolymorpha singaporensis TaxID=117157 RepID=A0A1H1V0V9_9ACTN|nr:endonuclease/exonuclease/phosphatase family protein [Actinopolymorpha singaporensis]SDS78313.1 Endonuclease/Exonuclease/phosphatase family protein [Actinopolymorpha singaporensis]